MKKPIPIVGTLVLSIVSLAYATPAPQTGCTTTPNPPPGCTGSTCVCDSDGNNCHWVYICPSRTAALTERTAVCPQDGETASFTGNKKIDVSRSTDRSRDVCEYSHRHTSQDGAAFRTDTHTFWQNCGD